MDKNEWVYCVTLRIVSSNGIKNREFHTCHDTIENAQKTMKVYRDLAKKSFERSASEYRKKSVISKMITKRKRDEFECYISRYKINPDMMSQLSGKDEEINKVNISEKWVRVGDKTEFKKF